MPDVAPDTVNLVDDQVSVREVERSRDLPAASLDPTSCGPRATSRDVGFGDQGELRPGQHEAALELRDDHRSHHIGSRRRRDVRHGEVETRFAEVRGKPLGCVGEARRDHRPITGSHQLAQAAHELLRLAGHRSPCLGWDRLGPRLDEAGHQYDPGGAGQGLLERGVMGLRRPRDATPFLNLFHDLVGPVAHALRLEDHCGGTFGEERHQRLKTADQQRKEPFRARHENTLSKLRESGVVILRHELGRLRLHSVIRQELPTWRDVRLLDLVERSLRGQGELPQGADLVPPELRAHRPLGSRSEDVQDAAPHGELAAALHHVVALVSEIYQLLSEVIGDLGAGTQGEDLDVRAGWGYELRGSLSRGDDHESLAGPQPVKDLEATPHRLDRR